MNADYVIQSVIFKQPKYTPAEAKQWLKKNNYSGRNLDRTANMLRFRQMTPKKVERYGFTEYRTKELGRSGISLVIAYKKSIEGGSLSNTFRNIWDRIRGRHRILAVDTDIAPAPQVAVVPVMNRFPPRDAEVAEAEVVEERPQAYARDDVEEYYTPLALIEHKRLKKKVKKAEADKNDAEWWSSNFGGVSMEGFSSNFQENRAIRLRRELEIAVRELSEFERRLPYLPLRNRPTDGNPNSFDRRRAIFYPYPPDNPIQPEQLLGGLEATPITDAEIAEQQERANNPTSDAPNAQLPPKPPPFDLSHFGEREAERLAEAERVYNETMEEEIEKQRMSGEDRPSGSGIYMKGFGRLGNNRMRGGRIVGGMISDDEEDEDEDYDEDAILEYNALVAEIIDDLDTNDVYLENDENDIISGRIVVPNKAEVLDRIQQKMEEYDTVRGVISDIIDKNQSLSVARLVKEYMDEYILIDTPFIDPLQWRGGALARYDV